MTTCDGNLAKQWGVEESIHNMEYQWHRTLTDVEQSDTTINVDTTRTKVSEVHISHQNKEMKQYSKLHKIKHNPKTKFQNIASTVVIQYPYSIEPYHCHMPTLTL